MFSGVAKERMRVPSDSNSNTWKRGLRSAVNSRAGPMTYRVVVQPSGLTVRVISVPAPMMIWSEGYLRSTR
jgi:hypothetical protein